MSREAGSKAAETAQAGTGWLRRTLLRLFHLRTRLLHGLTLGVRAVVLDGRGQVLLVRHTYTPGWYLPGGGVEIGETLEQALAWELREEGAIRLTGPAILQGVFFNRALSERDHVALYVVRDFTVMEDRKPDIEIAEARWFALDDLPEGTTPATRRRLAEVMQAAIPDAHW